MNMQTHPGVQPPPPPNRLEEMRLPIVMMRDILLKTMFRKNLDLVGDIAEAICLPRAVTQELVDLARSQKLIESLDPEQQEQLDALTKALVKKILHDPLRGIHEAAQEGDALRLEYLLGAWKEDER